MQDFNKLFRFNANRDIKAINYKKILLVQTIGDTHYVTIRTFSGGVFGRSTNLLEAYLITFKRWIQAMPKSIYIALKS